MQPLSRRHFFRAVGLSPLSLAVAPRVLGQEKQPPSLALTPLNRFSRSVQEWYVEQVRIAERRGKEARAKLKTKADAETYIAEVRRKVATSFGPFPEKTPLNAKVTGKLDRDVYTVEKVIFESRPDFYVTANLYLPKGAKSPRPAVVGSCGHSLTGKGEPAYQSFCQGLARMGYVVLIFDPVLSATGRRDERARVRLPRAWRRTGSRFRPHRLHLLTHGANDCRERDRRRGADRKPNDPQSGQNTTRKPMSSLPSARRR